MHPSVVFEFVEAEVAELRERLVDSPHRDATVTLDTGPVLRVAFDHEEHVTEAAVAVLPLLGPGGQQLHRQQRIPIIGARRNRRLILEMGLERFDLLPPTATLLDGNAQPLPGDQWPTSLGGGGIVDKHPMTGRPFFCRRGLREYHTHPQHEDDPWASWRGGLRLHMIVIELLDDLRERWHCAA
jgi:hypothetical protein